MSVSWEPWMNYIEMKEDGWEIREDAPEEAKEAFKRHKEYEKQLEERGIDL